MGGEETGYAEPRADRRRQPAGVGKVRVEDVGAPIEPGGMADQRIDQCLVIAPQLLLVEISIACAAQPHDARLIVDRGARRGDQSRALADIHADRDLQGPRRYPYRPTVYPEVTPSDREHVRAWLDPAVERRFGFAV